MRSRTLFAEIFIQCVIAYSLVMYFVELECAGTNHSLVDKLDASQFQSRLACRRRLLVT